MNIVRDSFATGLIGKQFQFQSSAEGYTTALIQADNVLIDPYGQVTRRPPLVAVGTISSYNDGVNIWYPKDARALDFVFSAEYRYIVSLVTYEAAGEDDLVRIIVKDTAGVEKYSASTDYTQLDVLEIDDHHSNDTMWIAHQNVPVSELKRIADDDWAFGYSDLKFGPFMDENESRGIEYTISGEAWDAATPYSTGKTVQLGSGSPVAITSSSYEYWYEETFRIYYLMRLVVGVGSGILEGDTVVVNDLYAGSPSSHNFSGTYEVKSIGTDYIDINTGREYGRAQNGLVASFEWVNDYPLPTAYAGAEVSLGSGSGFYTAKHSVLNEGPIYNTGKNISNNPILYIETEYLGSLSVSDKIAVFDGDPVLEQEWTIAAIDPTIAAPPLLRDGYSLTMVETVGAIAHVEGSTFQNPVNVGNDPSVQPSDYWRRTYTNFNIDINSNQDSFAEDDVDRKVRMFEIIPFLATGEFKYNTGGPLDDGVGQESEYIPVFGTVTIKTSGSWGSQFKIWASDTDGQYWEVIETLDGFGGTENYTVSREFESQTLLRLTSDGWATTGSDDQLRYTIEIDNAVGVIATITEYVDARSVKAILETAIRTGFTTYKWSMGSFGGSAGCPGTVTIHEDRLWLAGTKGEPFKHWGSVVNKYQNFAIATFSTSAIIFQARADSSTRISWVEPKDNLFFGTDFGEYSAINLNEQQVLSASNPPKIDRYSTGGSARIPAVQVGNALAYVSADRKKCKFLQYDGVERYSHRSYDMTHKVPDIAGSGFRGSCLQRTPYPILWFWTDDGKAISFTVNQENGIVAWAEHSTTGGSIKSLCVIPDEFGIDEIYAVVQRDETVLNASGNSGPDVNGIYDRNRPDENPDSVTIRGTRYEGIEVPRNGSINGKPRYTGSFAPTIPNQINVTNAGEPFTEGIYDKGADLNGYNSWYLIPGDLSQPYFRHSGGGEWYIDDEYTGYYFSDAGDNYKPPLVGWEVDTSGSLPNPTIAYVAEALSVIDMYYNGSSWVCEIGAEKFMNTVSNNNAPRQGWGAGSLGTTGMFTEYEPAYLVESGTYYLDEYLDTYAIYRTSDDQALFEYFDLSGTYAPISGSGATGSVEVQALNYHIEKLDYQEADYTDNLGGAVETPIISEWEPTPLSRGPGYLDGNKRFRSSRVILYVTGSNGGEVSIDDGNTWQELDYSNLTADANGFYTGFVEVRTQSGWRDYVGVKVRTTGTNPLNVTALKMPIDPGERK